MYKNFSRKSSIKSAYYFVSFSASIRKVSVYLVKELGMGIASLVCGDISLKTPFF